MFDTKTRDDVKMMIISYEAYQRFADKINRQAKVGLLVCDEGHRLKNANGSKTLTALAACPCVRRLLLTGTPVQNNLMEFFAIAHFVNPGVFGELAQFRAVYAKAWEAAAHMRDGRGKHQDHPSRFGQPSRGRGTTRISQRTTLHDSSSRRADAGPSGSAPFPNRDE